MIEAQCFFSSFSGNTLHLFYHCEANSQIIQTCFTKKLGRKGSQCHELSPYQIEVCYPTLLLQTPDC